MKKRVDALNRMVRVQTKMRDLGQWRVSALERERADLRDDLRSLFGALETCDLAHGWQAALTARRARALQKRIDDLEGKSERVRRKAETDGRRAQARRGRRRDRREGLSRAHGAQGARRADRARAHAPRRKPGVRPRGDVWRALPSPGARPAGASLLLHRAFARTPVFRRAMREKVAARGAAG